MCRRTSIRGLVFHFDNKVWDMGQEQVGVAPVIKPVHQTHIFKHESVELVFLVEYGMYCDELR